VQARRSQKLLILDIPDFLIGPPVDIRD